MNDSFGNDRESVYPRERPAAFQGPQGCVILASMIRCDKCGNEYPDDYRFCPLDGSSFDGETAAASVPPEAAVPPAPPEVASIRIRTLLYGAGILLLAGGMAFSAAFFYLYLKPRYGNLELKTTPSDAIVYLDGKQAGVSPLTLRDLRSGGHQVRIVKEGYKELAQSVQVIPYSTEALHWSLDPLVPQLTNEQLAEVEALRKKLESAQKENILLPPPEDYNVLYFANRILAIDPANALATEVKHKMAEEMQQKADVAYAREDWLEAEKLYRNLSLIFPDDVSIGARLTDIGEKIDASVKDRDQKIADLTAKVETALKAGALLPPEKDNALDAIRGIQRLDRKSAFAREAMTRLRDALQTRGDGKMSEGDFLGARNQFKTILQYFPDDPYSKSRLEQAEAKLAESTRAEQARQERQQEEQRSRQELENLHRSALNAYEAGDYAKALTLWQDYLKRAPNTAEAYFYLGAIFLAQKQLDSAILNFERCVSLNPENALAHLNLGILYDHHRNDPNRAIEHFKKVAELGGVEKYTPERLRSMIQELQERIRLAALEKQTFPVEHKHAFSSCRGHLRISSQGIEYRTTDTDHSFFENWSNLRNWAVEGDELSLRLENNKRYNFRILNGGDSEVIRRLMASLAAAR